MATHQKIDWFWNFGENYDFSTCFSFKNTEIVWAVKNEPNISSRNLKISSLNMRENIVFSCTK